MDDHRRQEEIFSAMSDPAFYPHQVERVDIRETHISKVFLAGDLVYKVKKAVNLGFLDFSTLTKRRHYCRQEVTLNRRMADDVYLGTCNIHCTADGKYRLEGRGHAVEIAVRMRRLPDHRTLAALLQVDACTPLMIQDLSRILNRFYTSAPVVETADGYGGWQTVVDNNEENFSQMAPFTESWLDLRLFQIVRASTRAFARRRKPLFDRRLANRHIRDGHGDLKCGHVYFHEGVKIIDCIEFNDRFRYGDVAADLAFLAMDLDFSGYPTIAEQFIEAYAARSGDAEVYTLLDFYKCYRAMVQAKVALFRLREISGQGPEAAAFLNKVRCSMDLAYRYAVQMSRPTLWVLCGLPASGKSTVAHRLAQALGVDVLRLDVIRKQMFGHRPDHPEVVAFETGIYSREASNLAYGRLLMLAQERIAKGMSVILDAGFGRQRHRDAVSTLAQDEDANIVLVHCDAPETHLRQRLTQRNTVPGVSDARLTHLNDFLSRFEPIGPDEAHDCIDLDTSHPLEEIMVQLLSADHALLGRQVAARLKA
jgi:aminoglycoside phosphotransferase family enzyme/predicted kinase